ncbi:MAG: hypothetical protein SFU55_12110 [Methylophilus sp.]|nr:hypothetical protein [Methylophilus sp.]
MTVASLNDYELAAEVFFKKLQTTSDIEDGVVDYKNYLEDGKTTDAIGAALSIVTVLDTMINILKEIPGLNYASLANNTHALSQSTSADGATDALVVDIVADIAAISASAALASVGRINAVLSAG